MTLNMRVVDARAELRALRFGDARQIEARRLLAIRALAARVTDIDGFCLCSERNQECFGTHRDAPEEFMLERMNREKLLSVVERLVRLGCVERAELEEVLCP